jgi:hypothetical protein
MSLPGFVLNVNDTQRTGFCVMGKLCIVAKDAEQKENQCDLFLCSEPF